MGVPRTYGAIATGGSAVVAILVAGLGFAGMGSLRPPDLVFKGLIFAVILATPGIIGLVGTRRRDRALLTAAAVSARI